MGHFLSLDSKRHSCFCAFCKTPRKVYKKNSINFIDFSFALGGAALITYLACREFNPVFFALFVGFLTLAEVFVRFRWRIHIVCKQCGFDPAVYLKNPHLAAAKVKDFLEKRKDDPDALLGPVLNLPKLNKSANKSANKSEILNNELKTGSKKGTLVSRQV